MTHAQFWASTPGEIIELYDGYLWRDEQQWLKTSWLACNIMYSNGRMKRAPDPVKMLGKLIRQPKKSALTREQQKNELESLRQLIDG